jgi:hypothetical protein
LQAAEYGLVSLNQSDGDFLYTTYKIRKGDVVTAQFPNGNGLAACCKKLKINERPIKQDEIPVSDELLHKPVYVYQIQQMKNIGDTLPFIGAASIGLDVHTKQITPSFLVVAHKNKHIALRTCISSEGLHLTGLEGSKKTSEMYFYFGYEVENPTCK